MEEIEFILAKKACERFKLTLDQLWRIVSWGILATDHAPDGRKTVSLEGLQKLQESGELARVRKKYPDPPKEEPGAMEDYTGEQGEKPEIRVIIDDDRTVASGPHIQLQADLSMMGIDPENISIEPEVFIDPKFRKKEE